MERNVLIFAYGSNMDLEQMRERCPESDLASFIAEARDWALRFPRNSDKRKGGVGSIERKQGSSVWGVVFAVSERGLKRLDRYEGVLVGAYTPRSGRGT
jgi:gamma-glutamylcyclotransferase